MTFFLCTDSDIHNKREFNWICEEFIYSTGHQVIHSEDTFFDAIIYYGNNFKKNKKLNQFIGNVPILLIPNNNNNNKPNHVKVKNTNFGKIIVDKTINWIYNDNKNITSLEFDLITFLFYYLAEEEYLFNESRDKYGRLTFNLSEKERIELENPIVNMWAHWVDNWLNHELYKNNKIFYKKCLWPNQAKIAISFSHDIDIVNKDFYSYWKTFIYYLINRETSIRNFIFSIFKYFYLRVKGSKSTFNNFQFDNIRNFHKKHKIKATFNIMSSSANLLDNENYLELAKNNINDLIGDGHEIGLHGGYESKSFSNIKVFLKEKEILERYIKRSVVSTRQHYLGFKFNKTFLIHENSGIQIDSTVGYPDKAGFKSCFSHPYQPWLFEEHRKSSLHELPLILMDGTMMSKAYSNLNLDEAKEMFLHYFNTVKKFNGVLTINWHQRIFSEGPYKKWMQLYYFAVDYISNYNVYKATQQDIIKRYKAIKSVNISMQKDTIIIMSPISIDSFSFIISNSLNIKPLEKSGISIIKENENYVIEITKMNANDIVRLTFEN